MRDNDDDDDDNDDYDDDDYDDDDDDDCNGSSPCERPSSPKLLVSSINILHLNTNMIMI